MQKLFNKNLVRSSVRCILAILANAPWVKSFGENCGRFSLVFWRVSLETLPFLRRKNVLFFLLTFCCKSWVPGGKGKKRRSQRDRLFFSGSNMGVFCGDISWRILLNDYWIFYGKWCGNSSCLQKFSSFFWMILPSQNSWSYGRRCWGLAKQHVELAEDWGGLEESHFLEPNTQRVPQDATVTTRMTTSMF